MQTVQVKLATHLNLFCMLALCLLLDATYLLPELVSPWVRCHLPTLVSLFSRGCPRVLTFNLLLTKSKNKLATWKACLLTISGITQLVKFVTQGMMIHSLMIYYWSVDLIKEVKRWCENFIWSVDVNQRKLVTVAWHNCWKDYEDGGSRIKIS